MIGLGLFYFLCPLCTVEVMIGESFEDMHHVRCKVLKECASVSSTEWKSILSSDTEYSHLDMSFCAVFVLPENWKWTDVIQCFPPDILDRTLQGIILINFQNSLTLSDDFFANVDLPDMFVCVVSRSNLSKILPLRTKSVLETQARVVRSTCIDFHSSKTGKLQICSCVIGSHNIIRNNYCMTNCTLAYLLFN